MRLDSQQKVVVHAPLLPTLVTAGAGTGKTHTLMHRVVHWTQKELDPDRVLLITFTQRAAREMKSRAKRLDPSQDLSWIGTFHATAARVLRLHAHALDLRPDFEVISQYESEQLLGHVLSSMGTDLRQVDSRTLLRLNSLSVNADLSLFELLQNHPDFRDMCPEMLDDVMVEFLVAKLQRNVMDYDDLLLYWSQLLRASSSTRTSIQSLFDAVFVDEYQDVNPLQVELIDAMVESHRRLTVVGDDRQSIYGFRGADVRAILDFESRYPEAQVLGLENNYRSAGQIIDLASASIRHNLRQRQTALTPVRPPGRKPVYCSVPNDEEQAQYVRQKVESLLAQGVPPEDIAILYRTHRQSHPIERVFQAAQIPYVVRSGQRLFDKPHVRAFIQLLSVFSSDVKPEAIAPALELFEGIGPSTSAILARTLVTSGWAGWMTSALFDTRPGLSSRRKSIEAAVRKMVQLRNRGADSLSSLVQSALDWVMAPWMLRRHPDSAAARYEECAQLVLRAQHTENLADFLSGLVLDEAESNVKAITLSTAHRAKGLEWAAVFVIGLFEGGFPLGMTLDSPENLEEERRLFYVSLTRSKDWLTLVHSWESSSGSVQPPSRFVTEILDDSANRMTIESLEESLL